MRHRGFAAWLDAPDPSELFTLDSNFRVVPGLSGQGVSFQSINYPGHYLRHSGFAIFLHPRESTALYHEDASFIPVPGHAADDQFSFQSVNYPERFLRHRGFRLYIEAGSGDLFNQDSTWLLQADRPPGAQTPLQNWGLVPIHMSVLSDGRVLAFGSPLESSPRYNSDMQMGGDVVLWDPNNPLAQTTPIQDVFATDSFCSSTKYVGDRLWIVGGNAHPEMQATHGVRSTITFNETTNRSAATETRDLNYPRWYSSLVVLGDGRLMTFGGADAYCHNAYKDVAKKNSQISATPEVFEDDQWKTLDGAYSWEAFGRTDNEWWYPRAYLAPDGKVFGVSGRRIWITDPKVLSNTVQKMQDNNTLQTASGRGQTTMHGELPNHFAGASCTSVLYAPGKLAIIGGGQRGNEDIQVPTDGGGATGATNAMTLVDYNNGTPTARTGLPMQHARNWATAVALPTGEVAVLGGTRKWNSYAPTEWVAPIEIWSPPADNTGGGTWRTVGSIHKARLYHSAALLLPDARILIGGGGLPPAASWNPNAADGDQDRADKPYRDVSIYTPPYLYESKTQLAARPTLQHASGTIRHGSTFRANITLQGTVKLATVSIISAPAVTHSHNNDQRYVTLPFIDNGDGTVDITIPNDKNTLPPGIYMIFAVDQLGVPSKALFVAGRLVQL